MLEDIITLETECRKLMAEIDRVDEILREGVTFYTPRTHTRVNYHEMH